MKLKNTTHSPLTSAFDAGEQTRTQFLKTLTLDQIRLLEKLQSYRDDVFEFAYQRNVLHDFNTEICDDSDECIEISKGFCDFNDVDVSQL
tara:strand:+ start:186 stop:455 length:270 start_codon:yes stop_codon:yes gene_type:complete